MKRVICSKEMKNVTKMTIGEDYDLNKHYHQDVYEYADGMYEMDADDIRYVYSDDSVEGSDDVGIETVDGEFYAATSGHGIVRCESKEEMLSYL